MRIGFDITAIPKAKSGVGFYVLNLLKALSEIDQEDDFFVFSKQEDQLHVDFGSDNFSTVVCGANNRLVRLGWEQTVLPRLISRKNLDVFHAPHYTVPLKCDVPTVTTFHDMTFFSHPEVHEKSKVVFFQKMIPLAARRAAAIIAVSQSTKNDVVRFLGVPEESIDVVYEGVDADFYRPIKESEKAELVKDKYGLDRDFALFIGTLEPRKNIAGLIEAFSKVVQETGSQYGLVIAGTKGWNYQNLFDMVQELHMEKDVVFTGYVPEEELPYLLNAASVFAYPSFYEGFGIPPLEAMACGVPTVTSNVSSLPEVVGEAGMLVDPHNTDEIAGAIIAVLTDSALRSKLARKGRERAQLFSWQKAARETLEIYKRVARNQ